MQPLVDLFYRPPLAHKLGSIIESIYAEGFKDGAIAAVFAFAVIYFLSTLIHNWKTGK